MIGYKIKNTSKYKVEVIINNEKVFLEPKSEKKIYGNSVIVNNFKEFIIIEPIYKKEKPVKIETEENMDMEEDVKKENKKENTSEKANKKKVLNNNETKTRTKRKAKKIKE